MRILYFWRWPARLLCHRSIRTCQYIDRPNDNHPASTDLPRPGSPWW